MAMWVVILTFLKLKKLWKTQNNLNLIYIRKNNNQYQNWENSTKKLKYLKCAKICYIKCYTYLILIIILDIHKYK